MHVRGALLIGVLVAACVRTGPAPSAQRRLRVMTYNIQSGGSDLARVAGVIRAANPDLAALQEVDVHWAGRSAFVDEATALSSQLGMQVRFARIYRLAPLASGQPMREFGVALLSRLPVVDFRNDSLTRLSTQEEHPVPTRMPGLLEAVIDVNGVRVRVFDTHLDYRADPSVRTQQVAEMLDRIDSSRMPTLVFGDLNAGPSSPELQPLLARLHDTWPVSTGPGFTYPATAPAKRIDYVLTSPDFHVSHAEVLATEASDHRPLVVDLRMN